MDGMGIGGDEAVRGGGKSIVTAAAGAAGQIVPRRGRVAMAGGAACLGVRSEG